MLINTILKSSFSKIKLLDIAGVTNGKGVDMTSKTGAKPFTI